MAAIQETTLQTAPVQTKRRTWSGPIAYLLIAPPVLIMAALIFWPAIQAVIETLFITDAKTGQLYFSLQNYIGFFKDPILLANFWFTIEITLVTVALLFVVGLPLQELRDTVRVVRTGLQTSKNQDFEGSLQELDAGWGVLAHCVVSLLHIV